MLLQIPAPKLKCQGVSSPLTPLVQAPLISDMFISFFNRGETGVDTACVIYVAVHFPVC